MENAKHIGCMAALAVALGVGMAVANTPAVASADSGKGSSSGESSSSSSGHSGSTSSGKPSAKSALSATNDAPRHQRRPLNPPGETAVSSSGGPQSSTTSGSSGSAGRAGMRATPETSGTAARQRGVASSRPGSGSAPAKPSSNPAVVTAAAATARDSSLNSTRRVAGVPSLASITPSAAAPRPPASNVITPTPADPVSHLVSTLINAVLSPFANSAPTAPVRPHAALTMMALARREFEQALLISSTAANPRTDQITNGLVTDTVGSTSDGTSSAVDPDFISSTHDFGLFSITSAADPGDNHFVAFVFSTPLFTNITTSGADPEDNLGFGAASTGVAGQTVNTFMSPFLNFSIAIPVEDPFAELFTELVRLGF